MGTKHKSNNDFSHDFTFYLLVLFLIQSMTVITMFFPYVFLFLENKGGVLELLMLYILKSGSGHKNDN